jgi:hypothetical protein
LYYLLPRKAIIGEGMISGRIGLALGVGLLLGACGGIEGVTGNAAGHDGFAVSRDGSNGGRPVLDRRESPGPALSAPYRRTGFLRPGSDAGRSGRSLRNRGSSITPRKSLIGTVAMPG